MAHTSERLGAIIYEELVWALEGSALGPAIILIPEWPQTGVTLATGVPYPLWPGLSDPAPGSVVLSFDVGPYEWNRINQLAVITNLNIIHFDIRVKCNSAMTPQIALSVMSSINAVVSGISIAKNAHDEGTITAIQLLSGTKPTFQKGQLATFVIDGVATFTIP
jgi:hypothetical protein